MSWLSTGVGSILKSPVWTILPTGVVMPRPTPSTMLCVTRMNWILNGPISTTSLGFTGISSTFWSSSCSMSFSFIRPSVSRVPYTGTLISFRRYGSAPVWSSCPCVMTIARSLCRFSIKYAKSGMTMSTPSISSSGNISPQSMRTISSPYSRMVELRPISPTPPSGMTDKTGASGPGAGLSGCVRGLI